MPNTGKDAAGNTIFLRAPFGTGADDTNAYVFGGAHYFRRNSAEQLITLDTSTPTNNRGLPTVLLAGDGLAPLAVGAGTPTATTLRVALADNTYTATEVDATAAGDNTIVAITNTPRLYYVCLSADSANTADVVATVKIGSSDRYKVSLKPGSTWARNVGAGNRFVSGSSGADIIVHLSDAQTVYCSVEYEDAA